MKVSYALLVVLAVASHQSVRSAHLPPCEPGFERSDPTNHSGNCLPIIGSSSSTTTSSTTTSSTVSPSTGTCQGTFTYKDYEGFVAVGDGLFSSCVPRTDFGTTYCMSDGVYDGYDECTCLACTFDPVLPPSCLIQPLSFCDSYLGPYVPPLCGGSVSCTPLSRQDATTAVPALTSASTLSSPGPEAAGPEAASPESVVELMDDERSIDLESSSSTTSRGATAVALVAGSALMGLAVAF